jgi:hypothetical protein
MWREPLARRVEHRRIDVDEDRARTRDAVEDRRGQRARARA